MSIELANFTDKLISVSDFSQGKAGKIFSDVAENNKEYIVLKNNQPTAVVISIQEYKKTQEKILKLEKFLEKIENFELVKLAEKRSKNKTITFEKLLEDEGFSLEQLEALSEKVEFE